MTTGAAEPTTTTLLAQLASESDLADLAARWGRALGAVDAAQLVAQAADETQRSVAVDANAAARTAQQLVALADHLGQPVASARTRIVAAFALTYLNRFDEALAVLDAAGAKAREAGDAPLEARTNLNRVHALARLGRLEEAVAVVTKARDQLAAAGQPELAAKAEANLGVLERMLRRPANAIACFERAIAAWGADPVGRAQLRSNIAEAHLDLDRFIDAEQAFREALAALESAQVTQAASIVEGNLADLLARQGRMQEALTHFERVRRRAQANNAPGDAARLEAEEADAFAQTGLLREAVAAYRAALPLLEQHGLSAEARRARMGLALASLALQRGNEAAEAIAPLRVSHDGAAGRPDGRVLRIEAQIAVLLGDGEAAVHLFREAVAALADRPVEQALARAGLATVLLSTEASDEVGALIDDGLAVARERLLRSLEAQCLHLRARWQLRRGEEIAAMADLRAAVERIEAVRGTLNGGRLRSAFAAQHGSASETLVSELLRRGEVLEALVASEQARSRTLVELMSGAIDFATLATEDDAARRGVRDESDEAALLVELAAVRHRTNALFSKLDRDPAATISDAWRTEVLALETRQGVLESRLAVTQRFGGMVAKAADADAIRAVVDASSPRTALVSYLVADGRLMAITVRAARSAEPLAARLAGHDLGPVEVIAEAIERWRFQLHRSLVAGGVSSSRAERLERDVAAAAQQLSDLLLRPLLSSLAGADRLQLVPAGVLHAVPFAALPLDGEPLVARMPVATVPSLGVLMALRRRATRAGGRRVVVGVADEEAPSIAEEASVIAAADPDARLLLGAEATIAALRVASREADLLHLASHGRFVAESPLQSGLRLADGWLTAREILSMRLPASLVVLSGCDTGRVAVDGGDEVVGLLRSFFASGARGVVLSGWPVHDESAVGFMVEIHDELGTSAESTATVPPPAKGSRTPASEVLRRAMLAQRARRVRMAEWAAFGLVGDVEQS